MRLLALELVGSALVLGFSGLFTCCQAGFDELVSEAGAHLIPVAFHRQGGIVLNLSTEKHRCLPLGTGRFRAPPALLFLPLDSG